MEAILDTVKNPDEDINLSYDHEADGLYISFEPGVEADDSEMTDGIITRYAGIVLSAAPS